MEQVHSSVVYEPYLRFKVQYKYQALLNEIALLVGRCFFFWGVGLGGALRVVRSSLFWFESFWFIIGDSVLQ